MVQEHTQKFNKTAQRKHADKAQRKTLETQIHFACGSLDINLKLNNRIKKK